ncbi:MAG: Crp/Fnr family transcriptional regulator [Gammaproteobacteria bacterium]|nr:Crp/Fnr family transcriptional regulator [Gammaproteobacteria bacterium]
MADNKEKQLLEFFAGMDDGRQKALMEYAEFLHARSEKVSTPLAEPEIIPRPETETVVGAIKRLSASYSMLDKQHMLHEISGLMAQNMLHGRDAKDVIDEVEAVFISQYKIVLDKQTD